MSEPLADDDIDFGDEPAASQNGAAIPAELRERNQWVVWRLEERDEKPTKVPYRADGTGRASSTDPATWSTYEAAVAAAEALSADGIGFVFSADDPYVGIDLDDLGAAAGAIILQLDSYTEHSVSGRGAHVIVRASLNGHIRRRQGPLEIYSEGRYFVMTGEHMLQTPATVEERQEQLERVVAEFLPAAETPPSVSPVAPVDVDDQELLDRMFAARNGAETRALWQGSWEGRYTSQSEADLALAGALRFWTGGDPTRMDALFRRSGLMRPKWDRRGESNYGAATIARAIAAGGDVYTPSPSSRPDRDAVGTQSDSAPSEEGETAIVSPRPSCIGTRDGTQSLSDGSVTSDIVLEFEDAETFASEEEAGADPIVGGGENILIAEDDDVMFYGDGGAGKTTLANDLAVHLAAGDDWHGIPVRRSVRVGLVENEGPRPLFRKKLRRKLDGWNGSPLDDRLMTLKRPWGKVSVDDPQVRAALADAIVDKGLDVVIIGPVTRSGMNEAGTLQQVRDFLELFAAVREIAGRRVTFILIHHENAAGAVSGAWEGAVSTLFHVQAQGNGQTRLFVQKARWSTEHHKQKLQLAWVEGEGFELLEAEERDDNTVADEILAYVLEHGGTGWNHVESNVAGKGDRLRTIRDQLLAGGRLVNRGSDARMKLWHGDDPALPALPATLEDAA